MGSCTNHTSDGLEYKAYSLSSYSMGRMDSFPSEFVGKNPRQSDRFTRVEDFLWNDQWMDHFGNVYSYGDDHINQNDFKPKSIGYSKKLKIKQEEV